MAGLNVIILNYNAALIFYTQYDTLLIYYSNWSGSGLSLVDCLGFIHPVVERSKNRFPKESVNHRIRAVNWTDANLMFTRVVVAETVQRSSLGDLLPLTICSCSTGRQDGALFLFCIFCMCVCDFGFISCCTVYDRNIKTWLEVELPVCAAEQTHCSGAMTSADLKTPGSWKLLNRFWQFYHWCL